MKKTLALILAAMMVAGTASVAFAVEPSDVRMGDQVYVWDTDESAYIAKDKDGTVEYGDKIAFELTDEANTAVITDSDEVKNLKAYPEYKVGEGLVAEKPTIAYRKVLTSRSFYGIKSDAQSGDITIDGSPVTIDPTLLPKKVYKDDLSALKEAIKDKSGKEATQGDVEATLSKFYNEAKAETKKEYRYVIELQLKDSTSTASKDFFGEMYVGRTSNGAKDERALSFNLTVSNDKDDQTDADYFEVKGKENWVIDFDDSDVCDIEFMSCLLYTSRCV